jgi:ATP-dependent 26S proteasome regulatory subunit
VAEGRLLRKLIGAGAKTQDAEFRSAAEEIIKQEREKRHHLLANDLERLLYGDYGVRRGGATTLAIEPPKDRERGLSLLELRDPVRALSDLVLGANVRATLEDVLLERSKDEVLRSYGLRAANRLMFYGPPGCGKTTAAEALATELGVPMATVRLDAVVSSYLGETAANLRKVFDFIEAHRLVVLFDEFDALGKEREDPGEHGELRRVINAFLQLLDAYRGPSLLISATNHEGLLDRALWRRFDEVMLFDRPTREQVVQLVRLKLRAVRTDLPLEGKEFLGQFSGMSHADIERVLVRAIKGMVLGGRNFLSEDIVAAALERETGRDRAIRKR